MKTNQLFDEIPFVNEECGDTMWNDENLNPPGSNNETRPSSEGLKVETAQDSSAPVEK